MCFCALFRCTALFVDAGRIHQDLDNLIAKALRYTSTGKNYNFTEGRSICEYSYL